MDIMDPYQTAREMLAERGPPAITHAVIELRSLSEEDDAVAVFAWELVLEALLDLHRTMPSPGETRH